MNYEESICRLFREYQPQTVLIIGAFDGVFSDETRALLHSADLVCLGAKDILNQLEGFQHFDLVVVLNTIECLSKDEATILISRLRDLYAKRLILSVVMNQCDAKSNWSKGEFLALGLTKLAEHEQEGLLNHLYGHDILNYKTTPDWLNSRFWANPELFGKHWW